MPSLPNRIKYRIAEHNAERLALKAQRLKLHGNYPGMLGTIEASVPTWSTKAKDFAAELGGDIRNLPLPAKIGLGIGAGGVTALGVREFLRDREAKRNRPLPPSNEGKPKDSKKGE